MPPPSLVGIQQINPATGWSTSQVMDTLPAGTQIGDRLCLFVVGFNLSMNSANYCAGMWGLDTGQWSGDALEIGPDSLRMYRQASNRQYLFVRGFTARHTGAALPQTLTPTNVSESVVTGGANDHWRAFLLAYRKSHQLAGWGSAHAFNADRYMPGSPPNAAQRETGYSGGTSVGVAAFGAHLWGINVSVSGGFTEQANYAETSSPRRTGVSIVDKADNLAPHTLEWEREVWPAFGPYGVALFMHMNSVQDPSLFTSGTTSVGFLGA